MKIPAALSLASILLATTPAHSRPVVPRSVCPDRGDQSANISVSFTRAPVSRVARLLLQDVWHGPFSIAPAVDARSELVSTELSGSVSAVLSELPGVFSSFGLSLSQHGCVLSLGVPVASTGPKTEPSSYFVYRPVYRSASSLSSALVSSVKGLSVGSRSSSSGGDSGSSSSSAFTGTSPIDSVVVSGPISSIRLARLILPDLDTPESTVVIEVHVFQVASDRQDTSGFQLALNLLQSRFYVKGISEYQPGQSFGSTFTIESTMINQVIASLSSDSRFREVQDNELRAVSGTVASYNNGQETPTLGSVSYVGNSSSAVQSVVYRDSGVTLSVRPTVFKQGNIHLDLMQETSSFANTNTGVNQSPTLTKQSLVSHAAVRDGDIIFLGGMSFENHNDGDLGLFGAMFGSNRSARRTDVVIVAQVRIVPPSGSGLTPRDADAVRAFPDVHRWSPEVVSKMPPLIHR